MDDRLDEFLSGQPAAAPAPPEAIRHELACAPCLPHCSAVFDRVVVSYLIRGSTTVYWTLLPTFADPGPLVFQLQVGRTANPDADDWQDVGLPVEDRYFAVDPEQRVYGKDNWTHYRVLLTTTLGSYRSTPESARGTLDRRSWRLARDLVRQRRTQFRFGPGGQRGYLLKRRQTGRPCPTCLDFQTREVRNPDCPSCFNGDALVRTDTGFRKIAQIAVGDRVLTIDGSFRHVTETMKRRYTGPAYRIRTTTTPEPIIVTPEHPFHALTGSHRFYAQEQIERRGFTACGPSRCDGYMRQLTLALRRPTGATLHKPTGLWRAKAQTGHRSGVSKTLGYFPDREIAQHAVYAHRERLFDLGHRLDWVEAEDLGSRGWIDTVYPTDVRDIAEIEAPIGPAAGRKTVRAGRKGATRFAVDAEFLWMVGMYIAEGSAGGRAITFSLHRKEQAYRRRLARYFEDRGFHVRVEYPHGDAMNVAVSSTTLAEWFPKWLGAYSHVKHVPEELMHLPTDKIRTLVQGIWDGDGTKDTNEVGQTSETLALQLIELLHRLGKQPTVYRMTDRPGRLPAWMTSWEEPTLLHTNRKGRWIFADRLLARISEHTRIDYDGYVHNLEVEGNSTYVVQNLVAHNCYGTGFACGYYYPMGCVWAEMTPRSRHVELDAGAARGTVDDIVIHATMLQTEMLGEDDVWVNAATDDRYYLHRVTNTAEVRGVPIVADVELRLIPFTSAVYDIPIPERLTALDAEPF